MMQMVCISELGSKINSWCQDIFCSSHKNVNSVWLTEHMDIYIIQVWYLCIKKKKKIEQSLFSLLNQQVRVHPVPDFSQ